MFAPAADSACYRRWYGEYLRMRAAKNGIAIVRLSSIATARAFAANVDKHGGYVRVSMCCVREEDVRRSFRAESRAPRTPERCRGLARLFILLKSMNSARRRTRKRAKKSVYVRLANNARSRRPLQRLHGAILLLDSTFAVRFVCRAARRAVSYRFERISRGMTKRRGERAESRWKATQIESSEL